MTYALEPFREISLDEALLALLIEEHETIRLPRLERLWMYYRNPLSEPASSGGSTGVPRQAAGLPNRLLSWRTTPEPGMPVAQLGEDGQAKEVVIENDIAWRVHTLVDFMFPRAPKLISKAEDARLREEIETVLEAVIEGSGGIALWQNTALLGSVYGYVDFLVGWGGARPGGGSSGAAPSKTSLADLAERAGSMLTIETVEAPRAIPLVSGADYRELDAYIIYYRRPVNEVQQPGMLARLCGAVRRGRIASGQRASVEVIEIHSARRRQRYEDGRLVADEVNRLGRMPVVHMQNLSQPLMFEGWSDVEPLIPLQDELNTRISDRANRVTMQSFRMWLGKGIEGFTDQPVGPGQMWVTDNLDASIESFGGDADSPSERAHIEELREAMDKASGVTPAAAGHIKARVGNLTSENALRISLMGTIAKVKRKRVTYGEGIQSLCELILHAADVLGVYRSKRRDRKVEIVWSDPLPVDESRRVADALAKAELGVPKSVLLAELGYGDTAEE